MTRNDERYLEAELYRLKARALLMRGETDAEVESLLDQALQTARSQQARSLELRAATDLAKFWIRENVPRHLTCLVPSIYACFTEGFNTQDFKNAKTLFAELYDVGISQANNLT